jgi:hypothetical protein
LVLAVTAVLAQLEIHLPMAQLVLTRCFIRLHQMAAEVAGKIGDRVFLVGVAVVLVEMPPHLEVLAPQIKDLRVGQIRRTVAVVVAAERRKQETLMRQEKAEMESHLQ